MPCNNEIQDTNEQDVGWSHELEINQRNSLKCRYLLQRTVPQKNDIEKEAIKQGLNITTGGRCPFIMGNQDCSLCPWYNK
ncbi:hypothetical protein [Candidatus Avelusimicrobium faecicola]|uniref:hypothetical protein n=1 Tax=Candidatus Avelusimicrobium faecicola TaxID=3416205 RepID=UPI003D0B4F23